MVLPILTNSAWRLGFQFLRRDGTPAFDFTGRRIRAMFRVSRFAQPILTLDTLDGTIKMIEPTNAWLTVDVPLATMLAIEGKIDFTTEEPFEVQHDWRWEDLAEPEVFARGSAYFQIGVTK